MVTIIHRPPYSPDPFYNANGKWNCTFSSLRLHDPQLRFRSHFGFSLGLNGPWFASIRMEMEPTTRQAHDSLFAASPSLVWGGPSINYFFHLLKRPRISTYVCTQHILGSPIYPIATYLFKVDTKKYYLFFEKKST